MGYSLDLIEDKKAKKILDATIKHPGIGFTELVKQTGYSPRTVSSKIGKLKGFSQIERRKGKTRHSVEYYAVNCDILEAEKKSLTASIAELYTWIRYLKSIASSAPDKRLDDFKMAVIRANEKITLYVMFNTLSEITQERQHPILSGYEKFQRIKAEFILASIRDLGAHLSLSTADVYAAASFLIQTPKNVLRILPVNNDDFKAAERLIESIRSSNDILTILMRDFRAAIGITLPV